MKDLIVEGWAQISQRFINEKVAEMPKRLREVRVGEGNMTGYDHACYTTTYRPNICLRRYSLSVISSILSDLSDQRKTRGDLFSSFIRPP